MMMLGLRISLAWRVFSCCLCLCLVSACGFCAQDVGEGQSGAGRPAFEVLGIAGRDALGVDRTALVVMLHGLGSRGSDYDGMIARVSPQLPGAVFLAPNAPNPVENGAAWQGYSWFEMAGGRADASRVEARDHLAALIRRARDDLAMPDAPVVLVGFSQGGGLAVNVGACVPELVDYVVAMGGVMDVFCPHQDNSPGFLLVHNVGDPRARIVWARRAAGELERLGHDVTMQEYVGDRHWPVPAAMADVERAIVAALRAP